MGIEVAAFRQETPCSCLPAWIRTALNHFGEVRTEEEIAAACGTSRAGTRMAEAVNAIEDTGHGQGRSLYLDPTRGEERSVSANDLRRAWADQGSEALVIFPPDPTSEDIA